MTETERLKANLEQMGLKRMAGTLRQKRAVRPSSRPATQATWDAGRRRTAAKTDRSVNYRIKKAHFSVLKDGRGFQLRLQPP